MVKVDIEEQEAKAFLELIKEAQVNPEMGYILTMLKYKIFTAFKKDGDEKNKELAKKMLFKSEEVPKNKKGGKEIMKPFKLCNRPGECCPTVLERGNNIFSIIDDFGGKITLTKEQIKILAEKVL